MTMYKNAKINMIKIPESAKKYGGDLKFVLEDGSYLMYQAQGKSMDCEMVMGRMREILKGTMELVEE